LSTTEALREVINDLLQIRSPSGSDVNRFKIRVAAKYCLERIPSNSEIISVLKKEEKGRLLPLLKRKVTRTISGVAIVAVMTKPYPCPQPAPCAYCPGGPAFGVPQSYTGFEPATMRGLQNGFDPYLQVKSRMEQLKAIGHSVDKIELIVMGGTFPATPKEYQTWFIQRCLDAITSRQSVSFEQAKKNAERSHIRNVGITVETRPDWAKEKHVDDMLNMGVTRVELGVQNPDDQIYGLVGRTHTVKDVIEATRIMKDAGLKIAYHLMPGMPGSNLKKDRTAFKKVFANPSFRPDMIKIYPCLVLKGTRAYEWLSEGIYEPYSDEEATNFIAEIKKTIPPWIRIMRVQRDIPSQLIMAGVKRSNLRQSVQQKLEAQGVKCRCIRCRETGHRMALDGVRPRPEDLSILTTRYSASEGEEIFISVEDPENDVLVGYLRLRVPSKKARRREIRTNSCSIVRELHVYGLLVPVGKHLIKAWQHKGYGTMLLAEAERISREEYDLEKILVTSSLGTKQYYKRFGYQEDGVYVSKMLRN
jgi:elongator complex protein 3